MIGSTVRLVGETQSVTLTDTVDGLMRQPGGGGWGLAPVVNSWFEGAGDGVRLRGTRRTRRELTIPIKAFGNGRQAIEDTVRLLARSIHDPFKVFIDFADGRSYWIDAVYDSGAEGLYGDSPNQFTDIPIVLHCTDPYWTSVQSQAFIVAPQPADAPFLPKWSTLNVGSALALGSVVVNNIGDVPSRPTWTIHGPGGDLSISLGGQGMTLDGPLLDTTIVTIQFVNGGWTIEDQNGVNLYDRLGATPRFIEFPPGASVVDISMPGTGVGSYVQCVYPERREIVY